MDSRASGTEVRCGFSRRKTMFGLKSVVYVHRAEEIPTVEHWAIIETSSYTTAASGEWAPGHGYPASTENYVTYTAYTDKADFEAEVRDRLEEKPWRSHSTFRTIHVQPLTIKTNVTLEFEK
jgi:hypothetical protein